MEAEQFVVGGYDGLKHRSDVPPAVKRETLERVIRLYESWDAAEPGKGYDAKAAEYRAMLPETGPQLEGEPKAPPGLPAQP